MAVAKFYPVAPAGNGTSANVIYAATLTGGTASGTITTGNDMLIRIANVNAVTVRFGTVANLSAAGTGDILLPPGESIWDMGHVNTAISIYALATTNVSVNVVVRN